MDPDDEGEQATSRIIKTTLITVVFTTCQHYPNKTTSNFSNAAFSSPVSIVEKKAISPPAIKKKKKKTIYLTFDDGPNKGTRKVLDIVKEEKVPVTLFIIGEHVYGSAEQQATYDSLLQCSYVEIANHSYTHAHNQFAKFYAVPDSAVKDFVRCLDSLHLTSRIIRTPGRNIWRTDSISTTDIKKSVAAADSLQINGFTIIGWDLEWHFDNQLHLKNTGAELLQQVDSLFSKGETKTPNHLVLLAHDQVYADAADSLELHSFIQTLKKREEYDLDIIGNYPGIAGTE